MMPSKKAPRLFEDFTYGMSRDELAGRTNARPCPEAPDNNLILCAPETINLFGRDWRELFYFNNLAELQQVSLVSEADGADQFKALQAALINAGWRPVFLESPRDALDILAETKRKGAEKAEGLLGEFEENALGEAPGLKVFFFPNVYAEKVMGKLDHWSLAVDKATENFVMADLDADADAIRLTYTAPLLSRKNALRYGQMIRKN